LRPSRGGQSEHELAAATPGILKGHRATVRFHDGPDDGKAHAGAGADRSGPEAFKDVLPLVRWDADPVVPHADDRFALPAFTAQVDVTALLRVPNSVVEQAVERRLEALLVCCDHAGVGVD
jgi:hypothetical protein